MGNSEETSARGGGIRRTVGEAVLRHLMREASNESWKVLGLGRRETRGVTAGIRGSRGSCCTLSANTRDGTARGCCLCFWQRTEGRRLGTDDETSGGCRLVAFRPHGSPGNRARKPTRIPQLSGGPCRTASYLQGLGGTGEGGGEGANVCRPPRAEKTWRVEGSRREETPRHLWRRLKP